MFGLRVVLDDLTLLGGEDGTREERLRRVDWGEAEGDSRGGAKNQ